ncbi:aminoglycoside phosphotransferase [Streptomyces sp. NPDC000594]|uniref:aminoglycoside phosphotransferase n=1 Tax=Streptomyces sp. NPDC000594 TaxID=3154261 RepID=UPI00331AE762
MPRQTWDELPAAVQQAVLTRTGPLASAQSVAAGFISELGAVLETADGGRYFVKGMRTDGPRAGCQGREALANPRVVPLAPELRWRVTAEGWDLLGFEYADGRAADIRPGSGDLPLVVQALTALEPVAAPEGLPGAAERWAGFLDDPGEAGVLDGDSLVHTDWNPANALITPGGGVRLVDFAEAARGAAWIDTGCWVVWLAFSGHTVEEAEHWAGKVPGWASAPEAAVAVFARAHAGYWAGIAEEFPNEWTFGLRDAAERWSAFRRRPAGGR